MDRRTLIMVVGGSIVAGPLSAEAQAAKAYRIGLLDYALSLLLRADQVIE